MEILNAILRRYINLSLLEIFLFLSLGVVLYYILSIFSLFVFLNKSSDQSEFSNFIVSIFFILFWFLVFLVGKGVIQDIFKFVSSFKEYNFKSKHWPREWEYQGNIRLGDEHDSLLIIDSNSGCILKNNYWKNLEINFKCKFPAGSDDQTLGIIFRAKSLSDYLMIQINNKMKKIIPHIRMEGGWETTRHTTYDINTVLERNVFFNVKLMILNENVELFINGDRKLDWCIPTHSDLQSVKKIDNLEDVVVPKIDFRKIYGRIGFRAYQGESAVIKKLSIKRIPNIL